jgi:hypothetical protein
MGVPFFGEQTQTRTNQPAKSATLRLLAGIGDGFLMGFWW